MFGFLKKIWGGRDKDPYLEYLKSSTGLKWERLKYIDSTAAYLCTRKNFYLERKDGGKVRCTRQARTISWQTPMGPFCEWFELNEYVVHNYVK